MGKLVAVWLASAWEMVLKAMGKFAWDANVLTGRSPQSLQIAAAAVIGAAVGGVYLRILLAAHKAACVAGASPAAGLGCEPA